MTNRVAMKTKHFKLVSILLVFLFIVMGLTFSYSPAKAVTTITVDDSYTWTQLKTAIESTYKGTDVVFNINRSTVLSATSQITISEGSTVTLLCANESHNVSSTDIVRHKDFHGSLFRVNSGAILNVQCCISGGSNSSTGALLYYEDNTRITDASTLSSMWNELINTHSFAPINNVYYGRALIWVEGGTVNVNSEKGVLKYNYNPYSPLNSKEYTDGLYRYNDREIPATFSETVAGTNVQLWYYNLPAQETTDGLAGGHMGSAIYNKMGKVAFSAGKIYGCVSVSGPAIVAAMTDTKSTEISGGQLYINLAREEGGGAVAALSVVNNPTTLEQLSIKGGTINKNRATLKGGGVCTNYNATLTMTGGTISDNIAIGGGGLYVNGGSEDYDFPRGGKTYIHGGTIKNNKATSSNGGGVLVGTTNLGTENNILSIKNATISNNVASAENPDAETLGETSNLGYGGGVYVAGGCSFTMENATVSGNSALGGNHPTNGTITGNGGGIYVVDTGSACSISGGSITSNTATGFGGGIGNGRSAGLTINNGTKVSSNTASEGGSGLYNGSTGTLVLSNAVVSDNGKTNKGGGVNNTGKLTVSGGSFFGNIANYGAGIFNSSSGNATISGGNLYNNSATKNGGGVSCAGSLTIKGGKIYSNTAVNGGGVLIAGNSSSLTLSAGEISENIAEFGAGLWLQTSETTTINGSAVIDGNKANTHGGGIYTKAGTLTVDGCTISNNTTTYNGAGIYGYGATINLKSGLIDKNTAECGGGIFNYTGTINQSGGTISNNTAKWGGGINYTGVATMSGGTILNNTATGGGGGIGVAGDSSTLTLTAGIITGNTTPNNGGGINVGSSCILTLSNGKIYNNTAKNGGGVYLTADGTLTMSSGEISNNTADFGGGISLINSGNATVSGGKIISNTADEGGGVHIQEGSVFSLTSNSIYSNTAELGSGIMLYDTSSVLNMSAAACVGDTNRDGKADKDDVYLRENTFISVPSLFTILSSTNDAPNIKALRAIVTPSNSNTGRIIAKYTSNTNAKGSSALYWNAGTPKMSEQYFTVKDKELRSGDQGAADNYESINNQDVFITEKYNISFDMNPPALNTKSVIHTIGEKEYIFNDLSNTQLHTPFYKYWYEQISFNVGNAVASSGENIEEWNTDLNGNGESIEKNKNLSLSAEKNKDYTLYAQWGISIEIDYNGNGATKGENFTDTGFSIKDTTYTLNSGETGDGTPVFERKETDEKTGETKLFSFTGWSFNKNDKAYRYKKSEKITTDALRTNAVLIDGRLSYVTTIYAIWDQYPTIQAVDRWFTLGEAKNGKITLEELLSSAKATDGDVGKKTDFYDKDDETDELIITDKEEFTIIDFNKDDFKAFTTSGNATVTYKAVDAYGNEAYKTVVVHIVDDEAQKQDETTRFTRFISSNYFKDKNGNFIEPQYGGLKENSKWRTDSAYSSLLSTALSNTKDVLTKDWTTVTETWNWTIDEIELCKDYVVTHGVGNAENPNALKEFYDQFGPDN